jgi:hypothetical protein
MKIAGYLTE